VKSPEPAAVPSGLLRIQDVAAEVGLTPRSIRYYEELGLLRPAARSEGAYRLYDADDLARLAFIRGLRDDAGFSLAEIGQLLEDEDARARSRERYRETESVEERRRLLDDALERVDRQMASLQRKVHRLEAMIQDAQERRSKLRARRAALADAPADGGASATDGGADPVRIAE
jgi:DNA-binding transcriptional MerR regulator